MRVCMFRSADTKEPQKHRSVVSIDEEDFPRGSSSILTPLEVKSAHEKAKQDVLFSTDLPSERKKGLKAKRKPKDILDASPAPKKSRRSVGKKMLSMKVIENPNNLYICVLQVRK